MSLTTELGSTQDGVAGTPFAIITSESPGTPHPPIQAVATVGNKSTWAEVGRTGIAAADTPGDLSVGTGFGASGLIDLENATAVNVRATCQQNNKNLTGYLVWYDVANSVSFSIQLAFLSDNAQRIAPAQDFACQSPMPTDVGSARKCKFFVTAIDAASTWSVYVRPI